MIDELKKKLNDAVIILQKDIPLVGTYNEMVPVMGKLQEAQQLIAQVFNDLSKCEEKKEEEKTKSNGKVAPN